MVFRLINIAYDLTADVLLFGFLVGDDSLRCGEDGDAESVQDAGHLIDADILAHTGSGDALNLLDSGHLGLRMVLKCDLDGVERLALDHLVAEDVALLAQDLGNGNLHLGGRDLDDLLTCEIRVADPGQIICNWISHCFVCFVDRRPKTPDIRLLI